MSKSKSHGGERVVGVAMGRRTARKKRESERVFRTVLDKKPARHHGKQK